MMSGIERRLDGMETRLLRVERQLGLARDEALHTPRFTVSVGEHAAHTTPAAREHRAPMAPALALPVMSRGEPLTPIGERTMQSAANFNSNVARPSPQPFHPPLRGDLRGTGERENVPALRPLSYETPVAPKRRDGAQNPWEQLIGLKLAGWIGAIVLVIGAGLGIKYAYDQGFFSGVRPAVWLSLLSLFAFALIGAGEYVYRRISQVSATGLFGAGVAMLFVISYAGHGYYGLYQQQTAFTLMALSTLVGAAVAMRARLVSIAVLSLIGGTLAPLVLHGDQTLVVPFLCYLLMLQVVALVLSWWGAAPKWWALRTVSLAGTGIWIASMLASAASPWGAVTFFAIAYAALYHAEVALSSARMNGDPKTRGAGAAFSVVVTAALSAALLWLMRHEADAVRGVAMMALSAITLAMSMLLRRLSRREALAPLAYAYRMQAAVLALIAVPVAFSGAAISIGWAGLALALAAVGARIDDRGARYTAIAAWALAIVNLVFWFSNDRAAADVVWLRVLHQPLHAWLIVAWGLAACGHVIAHLHEIGLADRSADAPRAIEGNALSIVASAVFAFATIGALTPMASSAVLIAYAWLLIGLHRFAPKLEMLPQAAGVVALTMAKWLMFDTISQGLMQHWSGTAGYWPIVNPLTAVGVALAGTMLATLRLMRDDGTGRPTGLRMGAAFAALLVVLWAGTMEVDRLVTLRAFVGAGLWPAWQLRHFTWTAWWAAGLTGFLAVAHARDATALRRHRGLQILGSVIVLLGCKYLLLDTLAVRLIRPPAAATVFANLQTFAGAIVFASLVLVRHLLGEGSSSDARAWQTMRSAGALAVTMLLWVGSLEIDRAFHAITSMFTDPRLAGQVALSIFWSLFAIAAVAMGFRIRLASLRYFGLGLFALTLLKVGLIDLQSAATGYRILSFMGLGALLLGTSVLYGKLSPRLLGERAAA